MCLIGVGMFVFKEQASLPKIAMLMAACGMVGLATRMA
jgi:multidrug transporter EmrE-like cation transporter